MAASKSLAPGRRDDFAAFLIVAVARNDRLVTVEPACSVEYRGTAAIGASCPFRWVLANVPSPNRQRPLALGGENRPRCGPKRAIMPGSAGEQLGHHAQ